jgi:sugar lactone lactonase YvrE
VIADGDRIVRRAPDGAFSVVADISASSLAVSPDNTIFVADDEHDRVAAVEPNGNVADVETLPAPSSIALAPDGTLYVVDQAGVEAVSRDGSVRHVISPGLIDVHGVHMAFYPSAVASDLDGNLIVSDLGVKLLAQFAPDGTLVDTWGPQVYMTPGSGLATAPDGTIVLAEWGGQIARLESGVLSTVADGYRANGVAVAPDGTIYFTDGGNGWREDVGLSAIDATGTITRLVS